MTNNNNFPIATLANAGGHLAGKKLCCKMDGSHGYYSVPMADEQPIQLLAFNFASRTYAFKISTSTEQKCIQLIQLNHATES